MKPVATIVLNRNLPVVTDALCEHLSRFDGDLTDIFVIEAGSDRRQLSQYTTWHADWNSAMKDGLRYCRGMNYGLSQLQRAGTLSRYQAFLLLANDTELDSRPTIEPLLQVLNEHPRVGILSPCSRTWGERSLLLTEKTKYFWFIHNVAYMLRREFIESVCNPDGDPVMDFLFDGNNFRGYGSEHELIAKAYANDFAAAITTAAYAEENESHLIHNAQAIQTESYEQNLKLYVDEGLSWMKRKYGFNSRWTMQQYVKSFYEKFFEFHPELEQFRI